MHQIFKSVLGAEAVHPDISAQYMRIGLVYANMCKYQLALDHMTIALNMAEELYGKDSNHITLASYYTNSGNVYVQQGKFNKALEYYNKSLKIQQANKVTGKNLCVFYSINHFFVVS